MISNSDLYSCFKEKPWSELIRERRLRWIGHLHRLPIDSPVRIALSESTSHYKRVRGGQATTYIRSVNSDLKDLQLPPVNSLELSETVSDRNSFRRLIHSKLRSGEQRRDPA